MTDPGLSNRLRQQSRRAGLMVGLSMALTIAICIGGFSAIYAGLVPYLSDIVPVSPRERAAPTAVPDDDVVAAPAPEVEPEAPAIAQAAPVETEPPAEPPAPAAPTATSEAFTPDFQIAGATINFRAGPSTNDAIIEALPPATPLQFLGEEAASTNPDDAPGWRKFKTEDGTEGWVREIDTEPYQE
ncbi:MAG: SH3 domain-containing protein [Chloroflexia bacterium]|jgi:hypothetical protein|nr:SH3 domain-containing protein [Chloroflexia bacterium]